MKKTRFLIPFFTLLLLSSTAFGQFGFGAQVVSDMWQSKMNSLDVNPTSGYGLGLQAYYTLRPKMRLRLGANYVFGASKTFSVPPTYNQTTNVNMFSASPDFQYALHGSFTDAGLALYAFAGIDINAYNYKISGTENGVVIDSSSGHISNVTFPFSSSGNYMGVTPHLGLGAEYGISEKARLFLELKYCFAAPVSDKISPTDVRLPDKYNPPYFGIDLGIRFGVRK